MILRRRRRRRRLRKTLARPRSLARSPLRSPRGRPRTWTVALLSSSRSSVQLARAALSAGSLRRYPAVCDHEHHHHPPADLFAPSGYCAAACLPPPPNNSTRSVTEKRKMAQFSNGRGRAHKRCTASCVRRARRASRVPRDGRPDARRRSANQPRRADLG